MGKMYLHTQTTDSHTQISVEHKSDLISQKYLFSHKKLIYTQNCLINTQLKGIINFTLEFQNFKSVLYILKS